MLAKSKVSLVAAIILAVAMPLYAVRSDIGTSSAVFLKIAPGSRPASMGEAYAGVSDDVNAIFYNPAGPARIDGSEFTAQYGLWLQNIGYSMLGFVYPVDKIGTFGLGVISLGVSGIERRSADTVSPDNTFGASDSAYIISFSRTIIENLSAGLNAKMITQKIDTNSATAYAGDIGMIWDTPLDGLSFGASAQNIGTSIKFLNEADPLPLNYKAGLGFVWEPAASSQITLAADANMPRDNGFWCSGGVEFKKDFSQDISACLRAGYKTVSQEGLGSGITAGAGIVWKQFGLDFAWVPYGDLGDTFRYSLLMSF